jgi:hypothetical protein
LVPIAAVEVRDVACDPALKCFGKIVHHFAHTVPIDVVEGRTQDFVLSAELNFCFPSAPVFVNGCLDGRADLSVADRDSNVFERKDQVNEGAVSNCINELDLGYFIASDVELLGE